MCNQGFLCMAPMTLYFLRPSPPCRAVLLLTKYLGLEIKIEDIDLFVKKQHLEPDFLKMNPSHTVPVLDDNGFYLWESRAILAYLANQYSKDENLYPKDSKKRANVDKMLYFDGTTLYANLFRYFANYLFLGKEPTPNEHAKVKDNLTTFDNILKSSPYAAGDHLTIADFSLLLTITTLDGVEFDYSEYKHISAWASKLKKDLPHYKEAVEPGLEDFKNFVASKKAELQGKK
uniref:Uncharacterized protein n=1 Tax=Strigamia maritima TaxID=126957 RepID=T1J4X2_STRMM